MIDFRQHKEMVRDLVREENDRDKNWKWSVHSITKSRILIRWSYLSYCGETFPNNCFGIFADRNSNGDGTYDDCIIQRRPDGKMIYIGDIGDDRWHSYKNVESAITNAIRGVAEYAHSRY